MKNLTQNYSELQITESSSTTIYGSPAHKIEFTATDDKEQKWKAMQIWTPKEDKAYLFTYKAEPKKYSAYLRAIQDMIKSFEFIK
jgi:hypothetical protein